MQSQSTKSGSAQCQPVFILVRALVGDVVVEERHVETRVVKLIAAVPQQPNSIILGLPDILLKIEQAHVDAGVQRRPKYERVMTARHGVQVAAWIDIIQLQPRQNQHSRAFTLEK